VVPVKVGSDAVLSRHPSGLSVFSPLNFELSNCDVFTSGLSASEVLPSDVDGSASNIGIGGSRRVHSKGARNNLLSSGVLRRELVGSAMLVESTDHHLDECSLRKASQALDGSFLIGDGVKHRDGALAFLNDFGFLSEAVLLELNPRAVSLFEDNLVSEDGSVSSSLGFVPSDFDVSADKLDSSSVNSGRAGGSGEGEDLGEITSSTNVLSANSESVLLSFLETVDRSSVLEESVSAGVGQRPGDLVGGVSFIPLDLE